MRFLEYGSSGAGLSLDLSFFALLISVIAQQIGLIGGNKASFRNSRSKSREKLQSVSITGGQIENWKPVLSMWKTRWLVAKNMRQSSLTDEVTCVKYTELSIFRGHTRVVFKLIPFKFCHLVTLLNLQMGEYRQTYSRNKPQVMNYIFLLFFCLF